jgi:hypothetical protein
MAAVTLAAKYELCAAEVTLNGQQARITGARNAFATVVTLPDGPGYEYAWSTVARVVAAGGAFRS